ncbi:MAG TPA: hypothetical protein VGK17_19235 [Propionicimonas sp.]
MSLSFAWFYPVRRGVIAFDDIGAILHWTADPSLSLLDQTLLDTYSNRWRPVFSTLFTVLTHFFGMHYQAYFWFNVGLTAVLVSLVFLTALKISSRPALSFGVAIVTLTTRFSYYQVTQVIGGPLEALCLIILVLFLAATIEFERKGRKAQLTMAFVFYVLIVHTHERYSLLVVFLIAFIATSRHLTKQSKMAWAMLSLAPIAFGVAIRAFVFHIPILVGTGSSQSLGFNWRTAVEFFFESALNVLGLNVGPGYLDGAMTFPGMSLPFRIASLALMTISLAFVVFAVAARRRGHRFSIVAGGPERVVFLGVVLIGTLIASFSVTIRVEPRWFYSPFVVLLLLLTYCASWLLDQDRGEQAVAVSCTAFLAMSLMLDGLYAGSLSGVYFMAQRDRASVIVQETFGRHGADLMSHPIFVIDPSPGSDWAKELTPMLRANSGLVVTSISTVASAAAIPSVPRPLVFDTTGGFHEVGPPTG